MLLKTYHKVITLFQNNHGYMDFESLRKEKVTVLQIRELEREGIIERFSRGWYWCLHCGFQKPSDYKYIEISKVNPESTICMDSACYLHGILSREPSTLSVSTTREDRKKMELIYPVKRFYLQNTGINNEIQVIKTEFGEYRRYSLNRSYCDCFRMKDKLEKDTFLEIVSAYKKQGQHIEHLLPYAKALRAVKCINDIEKT